MRVAVSRRGWWACWFLAGSAVLGAAWWWQPGGVMDPPGIPLALAGNESGAARAVIAKLPLAFEPNRGQSDGRVLFLSRNPGYSLFLTARGAVLGFNGVTQPLSFTWQGGASARSHAQGVAALPTKHNYLRGKAPRRWQRDIPTYAKVRYPNLYPGIDLVYYGRQQHLEYDLVVAPGADPAAIRLQLAGMDVLRMGDDGALHLQVADRSLTLSKPVIYQEAAGVRQTVAGGYVLLADNQVGLALASYDRSKPLVIDPVLSYSSYLGGSGLDQGKGVTVDGTGNIYVVGQTASADFPASGKTSTDTDAFVAKFNAAGTLQYATYLGGSGTDRGFAIAMDNADAAVYVVGDTDSVDFPIQSASQPTPGGDIDAFVAKFNSADLTLGFSTYLGGSRAEEALGVAVDGSGNAYVAGATLSADFSFPVDGAFNAGSTGDNCDDPSHPGTAIPCSDAYVVKYDSTGLKQYATFLGGHFEDAATAIAVQNGGEAYVTGVTYSTRIDFPVTTNGFQQDHAGGNGDAFILELNTTGNVIYGTYLGGGGWDQGQAIAVDGSGNVYVAGATNSGSSTSSNPLPLTNALQQQYGGGSYDAFVAKVTPTNAPSSQLRYLTYLGGEGKDFAFGIAVDGSGNAYVVGETTSTDFPLDTPLQPVWLGSGKNNWGDAFISKIDKAGYFLNWSTYLGGGDDDWANSVALDGSGGIYVAGSSFSTDFPTVNPFQPSSTGNGDALLFKLSDSPVTADLQVAVTATPDPVGSGETLTYQVVVSNLSTSNAAGGVVIVATLPGGIDFSSASPAGSCTAGVAQVTCNVGSIAAGGSSTTVLHTVCNTAGDITFSAKVARANQPDPNPANDSARVTTTAAVGSRGGGAWSVFEWLVTMIVYVVRRRRGIIQCSR